MIQVKTLFDYLFNDMGEEVLDFRSEFPLNQYGILNYRLPSGHKPKLYEKWLRVVPFGDDGMNYPEVNVFLVQHVSDSIREGEVKNLREAIRKGCWRGKYFCSKEPFYSQGFDFMLYRLDEGNVFNGDAYFKVVPSKYDSEKKEFVNLISAEVFLAQHLEDKVFTP